MPTSANDLVSIGVAVFAFYVLPSFVGFIYVLKNTPREISAAYGVSVSRMRNPKWRRGYAWLMALWGTMFGALATVLIWAGLGGRFARHLLALF